MYWSFAGIFCLFKLKQIHCTVLYLHANSALCRMQMFVLLDILVIDKMYVHSNTTCETLECHKSRFVLLNTLASLVLLSLTASRKAPSWDSWVSAGYSDPHRQMCRQPLFLFVKAYWHGITLQRHVFSSKPPSSGPVRDLYPTWPLLPTSSSHLSTYTSSCSQTRHNTPQPLTFVARTNPLRTGTPTRWRTVLRGGSRWLG